MIRHIFNYLYTVDCHPTNINYVYDWLKLEQDEFQLTAMMTNGTTHSYSGLIKMSTRIVVLVIAATPHEPLESFRDIKSFLWDPPGYSRI